MRTLACRTCSAGRVRHEKRTSVIGLAREEAATARKQHSTLHNRFRFVSDSWVDLAEPPSRGSTSSVTMYTDPGLLIDAQRSTVVSRHRYVSSLFSNAGLAGAPLPDSQMGDVRWPYCLGP